MDNKTNFEYKLQEMFQEHSIPLRDSQWNKMKYALLQRKRNRKKWMWIFMLILFISISSFGLGYLFSTQTRNAPLPKAAIAPNNAILDATVANGQTNSSKENKIIIPNSKEITQENAKEIEINNNNSINKNKSALKNPIYTGENHLIETIDKDTKKQKATPVNSSVKQNTIENTIVKLVILEKWIWNSGSKFPTLININSFNSYPNTTFLETQEILIDPTYRLKKMLIRVKNSMDIDIVLGGVNQQLILPSITAPEFLDFDYKRVLDNQLKFGNGANFGVNLNAAIFRNFKIGIGAIYNTQNTQIDYTYVHNKVPFFDSSMTQVLGYIDLDDSSAPKSQVRLNNAISYLQVPIQFRLDQPLGKKWKVGISAGYSLAIPLQMNASYYDVLTYSYKTIDQQDYQLAQTAFAGLHLNYKVAKWIWLGANYQYAQGYAKLKFMSADTKIMDIQNRINLTLNFKL